MTGTMYKNLCAHHLKGFHQAMEALPPHARYTQAFVWTQPQRAGLLQHRAGRTASCVDQNHRAPVSRKNQQPERTEPWVEAAVPATAQSLHWRRARATHSCVTAPTGTPRDPSDSSRNTGMYYQSLDPLQHHGTQGSRASLLAQQQGHQVPLTAWTPCLLWATQPWPVLGKPCARHWEARRQAGQGGGGRPRQGHRCFLLWRRELQCLGWLWLCPQCKQGPLTGVLPAPVGEGRPHMALRPRSTQS